MATLAALAVAASAPTASARPDEGPSGIRLRTVAVCPLERIGDQYVRCDDLTGAGARAPRFVPEAR